MVVFPGTGCDGTGCDGTRCDGTGCDEGVTLLMALCHLHAASNP